MPSKEHLKYRKIKFAPNVTESLFNEQDIELLQTYGSWLAALMTGEIKPETLAQERFVIVCEGHEQPATDFEKIWVRYIKRKLWESENPEYVGMQENEVLVNLGITGKGWGVYGHFK